MIGGMWMRILLPTGAFAGLMFVGYVLFSDSAVWVDLVKAVGIALLFGAYQFWSVRREVRRAAQPAVPPGTAPTPGGVPEDGA